MDFDWGVLSQNSEFMRVLRDEILVQNVYQKYFEVEEGEVVFDFGASSGIFTFSILDKKPKKVYCFEPHKDLFKTLKRNVENKGVDVTCTNAGIGSRDGKEILPGVYNPNSMAMWSLPVETEVVSFSSFVKKNNVQKIDFMKLDCEGGEYEIFKEQNYDWLMGNLKKTAGEWHLHNPELKEKFKDFRDKVLGSLSPSSYEVSSMSGEDIKNRLWSSGFLDDFECIMLYIRI
jgi:FkbM family methyltransferase